MASIKLHDDQTQIKDADCWGPKNHSTQAQRNKYKGPWKKRRNGKPKRLETQKHKEKKDKPGSL